VNAGGPSLRDLERISRGIGNPYSKTTFSQQLNGKSTPQWPFVETFVRSCAIYAGKDVGQAELTGWRTAHNRLFKELAAVQNNRREELRGTATAKAELAAVAPDAKFIEKRDAYLDQLRERYRDLDHPTDALARRVDGVPPPLPLREIFVPQSVRGWLPETELPREVRRRLIDNGRLSERDMPKGVDKQRLARELRAYADSPKRAVLDVISEPENRRIVMLGDPGAGKSTLATYVALALADLAADDGPGVAGHRLAGLAGYLPLFIELRTYAPHMAPDPGEKVTRGEAAAFLKEIDDPHKPGHPGMPRELLEPYLDDDGPALVIFDGLDEVFDKELRERIRWGIFNFALRYKGVRVLVTSRTTDYEPEFRMLADHDFRHFALQDLDDEQIARFVRGFYLAAFPHTSTKALTDRLLRAVSDSPAIEELAGNPMLLTALALLGRSVPLPHKRGAVLKHMIEVLVHVWDAEKSLEKYRPAVRGVSEIARLDAEDKQELLRLVARRIREGGPGAGGLARNYLSGEDLRRVFMASQLPDPKEQKPTPAQERTARNFAKALVDQLRERDYILANFGDDEFGFVHRALLDYLAADDINAQFNDKKIEPSDMAGLFGKHATTPEWQEILLLLTGMLPADFAGQAVGALLESNLLWYQSSDPLPRHVLLAIRCLGEIRPIVKIPSTSRAVVGALIGLLETLSEPADYPLAADLTQALERDVLPVLAGLGPDWAGRDGYETWYLARGQFLGGDAPGFAAIAAARIYVALHSGDEQAMDDLLALARSADSALVRGAAIEALATNWREEPEVADLLRAEAAADGADWYVRREAVRALAARWPGDQAIGQLIRERAKRDRSPEVRGAALRWLATGWREADSTAELLRAVGTDPAELGEVRAVAVAELAAGWHDARTREWLWNLIDDENARVRSAAAEALATGSHDAHIHQWLCAQALSTGRRQAGVRLAAVRGLAAGWPDSPETEALLTAKARIGGEDDPTVRQAALEALAAAGREGQKMGRWLREQVAVEVEPNDDVRCVIVQALATYWGNDEATADLLKDLAGDRDWYVRAIAIRAVADIRADDRKAAEWLPRWLREQAAKDTNKTPYVRRVALNAAAEGWPEDPTTVPWLRERAADGREDPDVRSAAIQVLAARWPNKETLELLRAIGDGNVRTGAMRRVAVRLVATGWRDDSRTHAWLSARATGDSSPTVRRTALQLLAADAEWHDEPETIVLLRDRAVNDESLEVRRAAMRTLAAGWPADAPS
jgi:HEAT repeat protein